MDDKEVLNRRVADENHVVTTVKGEGRYREIVCAQCPWKKENDGSFPAEAFRISAETSYDMAQTTFACHMDGIEKPGTCAGFLLSEGAAHNLAIRMRLMQGDLDIDAVSDGGHDLHPNYRSMAIANGVDPDDERIEPCR